VRIAILETGAPPASLALAHGDYPAMFRRLFAPLAASLDVFTVKIATGAPLPALADFDGILITGSPAAVYEDHAWIAPLKDLVRGAAATKRPAVGVCFGHQLMAEAFGGRVERSKNGWGVGVQDYDVIAAEPFMRPATSRISCAASHQDQVILAPPGARILASSDFCPYAALAYRQGPAISLQMHPEFTPEYAHALLDLRKERFAPAQYDAARASLTRRTDSDLIARWIATFFEENAR